MVAVMLKDHDLLHPQWCALFNIPLAQYYSSMPLHNQTKPLVWNWGVLGGFPYQVALLFTALGNNGLLQQCDKAAELAAKSE